MDALNTIDSSRDIMDSVEPSADAMPWILFAIDGQLFTINALNVISIIPLDEQATPVADYPDCFRGIFLQRGEVVPLLELRKCLNKITLKEEYESFVDMIEQRKMDHVVWVDTLRQCIEQNEVFPLATDPHQCAFGKWYDAYNTKVHSVKHHLAKIDEPHRKLHETAEETFRCEQNCDACEREQCLKESLRLATEEYMPTVLALLDEAKEVMQSDFHETCLLLSKNGKSIGVIVDDVLSVDQIEMVDSDRNLSRMSHSDIVLGIAHCSREEGEILAINEDALFAYLGEDCED